MVSLKIITTLIPQMQAIVAEGIVIFIRITLTAEMMSTEDTIILELTMI
jgi:hypothetical protein